MRTIDHNSTSWSEYAHAHITYSERKYTIPAPISIICFVLGSARCGYTTQISNVPIVPTITSTEYTFQPTKPLSANNNQRIIQTRNRESKQLYILRKNKHKYSLQLFFLSPSRPSDLMHTDLTGTSLDLSYDGSQSPGSGGSLSQQARNKRMRTSFKHHQLRTMKSYFAINQNPDAKDLKQLSQKTGLSKRVLQVSEMMARAGNRLRTLTLFLERIRFGFRMPERNGDAMSCGRMVAIKRACLHPDHLPH